MTTVAAKLLTIEEYLALPNDDRPTELVRGRVVEMGYSRPRHGEVCVRIVGLFLKYLGQQDVGRVVSNDTGVITAHDPDTLRGADVAYYSYGRVPKGPMPRDHFLRVAPEIIFEVLSPDDRRGEILAKVAEYLKVNVLRVCLVDTKRNQVIVYGPEEPEVVLGLADALTFPDILPGFSGSVRDIFA